MTSGVLIVGTGALATLFAARLSAVGNQVTMLGTWPAGLAALQKYGARLDDSPGRPVQVTDDPHACREAQVALVMVKAWQTERAASQLARCLSETGLAVTFQNGLGNDLILADALGSQRVSRGVITLGATLVGPGLVRSGGAGVVTMQAHPLVGPLSNMLRVAGFDLNLVQDPEPAIWGKLVVNAAINPLTALLRVKNGELLADPHARLLMNELAVEAGTVAKTLGVVLPFSDPGRVAEQVAERTAGNTSSMLQDVLRGAPTEVDAINGAIYRAGEQRGLSTPVNRVVWSLVKAISGRVTL